MRGRDAGRIDSFVQMRHLHQACRGCARHLGTVIIRHRRRRADHHVAKAGFADIGPPVIRRETLNQVGREFEFTVHEDHLVGHEHILNDDHRLLATVLGVADIDIAVFHRPRVARLATVDEGQTRIVDGDRTDDRVILVVFGQPHGRHDQRPMGAMQPVW